MKTNRFVYIRTDGNSQIASGHLMRCISIAQSCKRFGMDIHFLVSDEESVSLFQKNASADFTITCLKSAAYDHLEQELPELLSLLANTENQNKIFLLDSYYATESYLTSIRKLIKTAYIDDLMLFHYPVDLLVNYDVIPAGRLQSYRSAYSNAGKTLLGAAYAPLRSQFQNGEMPLRRQAQNIFLTTGGSDPLHFCLNFIRSWEHTVSLQNPEAISGSDGILLHVLVGSFNTDRQKLFSIAQSAPFLRLYENVTDMATLMESCDLAVSAAGTTLYELCALGVPTISYTMADNQIASAKAFAESEIIPYSGDIRTSMSHVLENIMLFLTQMSEFNVTNPSLSAASYEKREMAHRKMRSFIDGCGSDKIARAMLEL